MEIAPTEKIKMRRRMAAAAGKKALTSISLFLETYGLEVKRSSLPLPPRPGQKELGLAYGTQNKKKHG